MYDNELLIQIGEVKGLVQGFITSQTAQDKRLDGHDDALAKLEERLSVLEQGKAWVLGAAAAISAGIGYVFGR